ncbi:hypothetical protein GCM10023090_26700 [Acidovorax lacteus]|uniref:Anti sigma-E protein RseA N-terminal domain-containing protein n=2 Tax=Acidovorax lacteus TaxID=1924988 RepID=A0ABP8LEM9_9BURK
MDVVTKMDDLSKREQLSAWMDGELPPAEHGQAWEALRDPEAVRTWEMYHLIGDVMRSDDLARRPDVSFVLGLRERLQKEAIPPSALPVAETAAMTPTTEAANASVFRWKFIAGLASVTAVAVVGWAAWGLQGASSGAGPAMASATPAAAPTAAPPATVAVAEGPDGQQVMLRDPRLDELLAAHKQFGNTNTLQMPAGFLRNATFDSSGR